MDSVRLVAHGLRFVFDGLKQFGIAPAAGMSPGDIRANAYGLSYAVMATLWQKRKRVPKWSQVDAAWERLVASAREIEPALYGSFDPADRIELLTDNRHAFEVRDRLFESARKSIDIATYYLQTDTTSWVTTRRLAACAERGVKVRILADSVATGRKLFERHEVGHVITVLRRAGVDYRLFRDAARAYDACHRKMILVDGETFITGGRNFADHYSGDEWRDIDIVLRGPSVSGAQGLFDHTFESCDGHRAGTAPERSVFQTTTPGGIEENRYFRYLISCIRASRQTIDIENAYYIHHPILDRHLAEARARGVRVRIFTNSAESNDLDFTNYRIYSGFPRLLDLGVELYLRRGKACTLHCKYTVVDGEWVSFGSSNLDYYSPRFCAELLLQARSREFAAQLTGWFERGIAEADRLTDPGSIEAVLRAQPIGRIFDRYLTDIQ